MPTTPKSQTPRGRFWRTCAVEAIIPGEKGEFFDDLRETNDQFRVSSEKVLALYEAGRIEEALALHMADEHAISHLLEPAIRELVADASTETAAASAAFDSDKSFLRTLVLSISSASLALAILMGFVLSLAFIRPVRQIGYVLARVAGGDFSQRVDVPNRDEFDGLSRNVNRMSEQLGDLYQDLRQELRERERAEARLERRAIELVAVNNELEAFSHSVLHDLLGRCGPSTGSAGRFWTTTPTTWAMTVPKTSGGCVRQPGAWAS